MLISVFQLSYTKNIHTLKSDLYTLLHSFDMYLVSYFLLIMNSIRGCFL